MANVFSRSWEITKITFDVIKHDKELLIFPVLSFVFSALFIGLMVVPQIMSYILEGTVSENFQMLSYVIVFLTYLGIAFIATFFNVCTVYTVKTRFSGGNATFSESIKFGFSKIHLIFYWSLLAAIVGLILRILDNAAKQSKSQGAQIGLSISRVILGAAWGIATIFVVPGMVYYNLGPIEAIKKSVSTLKKTWGESLVKSLGLGLVQMAFILAGIIVFGVAIYGSLFANPIVTLILVIAGILYVLGVALIFGVASMVFDTALFVYADSGNIPTGYSRELLHNAFR